jgi:hypothetical protein
MPAVVTELYDVDRLTLSFTVFLGEKQPCRHNGDKVLEALRNAYGTGCCQ